MTLKLCTQLHVLFTPEGRALLAALAPTPDAYAHCDQSTHRVILYGTAAGRAALATALRGVVRRVAGMTARELQARPLAFPWHAGRP